MIDFIKINISYMPDEEISTPDLWTEYDIRTNGKTGEIKRIEARYHNMEGTLYPGPKRKELKGSLHTLHNSKHKRQPINYNAFCYHDVVAIIEHLEEHFGIDAKRITIENLEYGINIPVSFKPEDLLINSLIAWDCNAMTKNLDFDKKGKFCQFDRTEMFLKMYDKGKHQKREDNIFRIEKHIKKNRALKKYGVVYLSDLKQKRKLALLMTALLIDFDKTVIIDISKYLMTRMPDSDRKVINDAINPKFWERGFPYTLAKKRFLAKLSVALSKYYLDHEKKGIKDLMLQTIIKHLECNDFTAFMDLIKEHKVCNDFTPLYTVKSLHIDQNRVCLYSGFSIAHQRKNSKYLSAASLYKLKQENTDSFADLKSRFKFRKPKVRSTKELCERMAKAIRMRGRRREQNYESLSDIIIYIMTSLGFIQ